MINTDPFVGRALTVQYSPNRPEIKEQIDKLGEKEGRIGPSNSWPIDMLKERDVYVADGFGKVFNGTLIGDNLGNSIYAKSKTGVILDAGARDLEGLSKIDGFNAFVRGFDPTFIMEMTVTGQSFEMPNMFPRLFVKALPHADTPTAINRQVVMMVADTEITQTLWGEGDIRFEDSEHDPLSLLKPVRVVGVNFVAGSQVLNWGKVVA